MAAQNGETDALVKVFETYKQSRKGLEELLEAVENAYRDIEKRWKHIKCMPQLEGTGPNLSDHFLDSDERNKVTRALKEPSIIFVGQTNAGKSSLINEILGETVVQASQTPCTARIVQLSYGDNDKPITEVRNKNGELCDTELTKSSIPTSFVNLKKEDRDRGVLVQSKVFVKIKSEFLKSGVNIIDTPGKNENDQLDSLVDEHMKSVLPLVVYVIDGTNQLSTQEVSDIGTLYECVPQGNMFFVVTKCDTEQEVASEDEDEDKKSPSDYTQPTDYEIYVRDGVYKKLVNNKFLKDLPISQCKNYHTLSSRRVKSYRLCAENRRPYQRYMNDFNNFKTCLLDFTRQQIIQTVTDSVIVVQCSLMKCLDYFIDNTNNIINDRSKNEENITLIQKEEKFMSDFIQKALTSHTKKLAARVTCIVAENKENIFKTAREFKFVKYVVPHNGYIDKQLVGSCKKELAKVIMNEVNGIIHRDVMNEYGMIDAVFFNVSAQVSKVQENIGNKIPIYDALQQMLVSNYKLRLNKVDLTKSTWQNIKHVFKTIWEAISLKSLQEKKRGVNVTDKKWKQSVAEEILEQLHAENVAERIVNGIADHVNKGHDNFQTQLTKLRELYDNSCSLGERDRMLLRKMAPTIGHLELCSWNIIAELSFTDLEYGEVIGKGAQGVVMKCNAKGPKGEECVAKIINLENVTKLEEISLEVHYSRRLDHKNIVKVYGTIFKLLEGNMYELAIIMPRLKSDLLTALPRLPQLSRRLEIAQQIASALSYMHHKGLMHRDIKSSNILLDDNNQAQLADFGFCKPPGMSDASGVGTLVHMSPEILKQEHYSYKVDVYAFGILLWYICQGGSKHPKIFNETKLTIRLLEKITAGQRPERLEIFRADCWNLMEKCWAEEPIRPDMDNVMAELDDIVKRT